MIELQSLWLRISSKKSSIYIIFEYFVFGSDVEEFRISSLDCIKGWSVFATVNSPLVESIGPQCRTRSYFRSPLDWIADHHYNNYIIHKVFKFWYWRFFQRIRFAIVKILLDFLNLFNDEKDNSCIFEKRRQWI